MVAMVWDTLDFISRLLGCGAPLTLSQDCKTPLSEAILTAIQQRRGYFTPTGSNIFISQPCFTFIRVIDTCTCTLYYLTLHTYQSVSLCRKVVFSGYSGVLHQ